MRTEVGPGCCESRCPASPAASPQRCSWPPASDQLGSSKVVGYTNVGQLQSLPALPQLRGHRRVRLRGICGGHDPASLPHVDGRCHRDRHGRCLPAGWCHDANLGRPTARHHESRCLLRSCRLPARCAGRHRGRGAHGDHLRGGSSGCDRGAMGRRHPLGIDALELVVAPAQDGGARGDGTPCPRAGSGVVADDHHQPDRCAARRLVPMACRHRVRSARRRGPGFPASGNDRRQRPATW